MNIYESAQDYLERILMLEKKNEIIRCIDIANDMKLTKQSVHRAMKNLFENGYIFITENNISLSNKGREIAEKIYDRHNTITKFLTSLGVNEKQALVDACKIEHDISDESFNAIKEYITKGLFFK